MLSLYIFTSLTLSVICQHTIFEWSMVMSNGLPITTEENTEPPRPIANMLVIQNISNNITTVDVTSPSTMQPPPPPPASTVLTSIEIITPPPIPPDEAHSNNTKICVCDGCNRKTASEMGYLGETNGIYDCYILYHNTNDVPHELPAVNNSQLVSDIISALGHDRENHFRVKITESGLLGGPSTLSTALIPLYPQMINSLSGLKDLMKKTEKVFLTNFILPDDVDLSCVLLSIYPTVHLTYMCDTKLEYTHLYRFKLAENGFDSWQNDIKIGSMIPYNHHRPSSSSSTTVTLSAAAIIVVAMISLM